MEMPGAKALRKTQEREEEEYGGHPLWPAKIPRKTTLLLENRTAWNQKELMIKEKSQFLIVFLNKLMKIELMELKSTFYAKGKKLEDKDDHDFGEEILSRNVENLGGAGPFGCKTQL